MQHKGLERISGGYMCARRVGADMLTNSFSEGERWSTNAWVRLSAARSYGAFRQIYVVRIVKLQQIEGRGIN